MSAPLRAVLFDWAGTLVDFGSQAPVTAVQAVFAARGTAVAPAEVRAHMGRAKRDHLAAMLAEPGLAGRWAADHGAPPGPADLDALMQALEPALAREAAAAARLIPGVGGLVRRLAARGVRIGSTTGGVTPGTARSAVFTSSASRCNVSRSSP